MTLWNAVCQTDPHDTKDVDLGGRSYTSVKAYTRIQKATEMWGPIGKGWGFHATLDWQDEIVVAEGTLWWGEPKNQVQAFGAARRKMKAGIKTVDPNASTGYAMIDDPDAAKKAHMDCLTKALSFLGFSADVYLGKFDNPDRETKRTQSRKTNDREIDLGALRGLFQAKAISQDKVNETLKELRETSIENLTSAQIKWVYQKFSK